MPTRNCYGKDVFNGTTGIIVDVDTEGNSLVVDFDDGENVIYESHALDEIVLGYATTVHKSQGSEYKVSPCHEHDVMIIICL